MPDTIFVRGLKFNAIIGLLPTERTQAQPLVVDLEIETSTRDAARSEDLDDTVDYAYIAESVQTLCVEARALLVERLAEAAATFILQQPRVDAVRVTIAKPAAFPGANAVGVSVHRSAAK